MAELRKNPLTREWVIISPTSPTMAEAPDVCPYCPGNESRCGPESLAYRDPRTAADTPGWRVRVVPNRGSYLGPGGELSPPALGAAPERGFAASGGDGGIYVSMAAAGADEIIIETPSHDEPALASDALQAEDALWACRERYAYWCALPFVRCVVIAREHPAPYPGHPHWRLLALPVVPQPLWELAKGMAQYYDYRGRCGVCHLLSEETKDASRVVAENRAFVAIAPYFSAHPYEIWVVPRRHHASLLDDQPQEMQGLARVIAEATRALEAALPDPRCVLTFMSAPCNIEGMERFHWFLRIAPGVGVTVATALACGIASNPVAPETAAQRLRRALPTALVARRL